MSNKILNGKLISDMILDDIKYQYSKYKENKNCTLVVITIGDDSASKVYVNNKKKACEYVGFQFRQIQFSANECFSNILNELKYLNNCKDIDGIIIQLPIISNVLTKEEKECLTKSVYESKDVDGFLKDSAFIPCTPKGIIRMLDTIKYEYKGKTALVIGRSDIVGKPIAKLLLDRNCTVIQAHSKTPKERLLRMFSFADIVITAVGRSNLITEDDADQYFKDNRHDFYGAFENNRDRVIIDVGINRDKDNKLCGDLNEEFKAKYSDIYSPVPKGVGPMTVAMLIENVWESFKLRNKLE